MPPPCCWHLITQWRKHPAQPGPISADRRAQAGAGAGGCQVLDHFIVGSGQFCHFRRAGHAVISRAAGWNGYCMGVGYWNASRSDVNQSSATRRVALLVMLIVLMGAMAAVAVSLVGSRQSGQRRAPEAGRRRRPEGAGGVEYCASCTAGWLPRSPGGFPVRILVPGDPAEGTETYPAPRPSAGCRGKRWAYRGWPMNAAIPSGTRWAAISAICPMWRFISDTAARSIRSTPPTVPLLTGPARGRWPSSLRQGAGGRSVRDAASANCPALGGSPPPCVPGQLSGATASQQRLAHRAVCGRRCQRYL